MHQETTTPAEPEKLAPEVLSDHLRQRLAEFVGPLLTELDRHIDRRLVRTLLATLAAIVAFRHRNHGLLLSELGAFILTPARAPAGTKRLSNLLRCPKWSHGVLSRFLWRQADARMHAVHQAEGEALLLWDESVVEKPESLRAEGLGPVRSSKAARLKRIRPGFYNPPGGRPVCVPGFQWLCLLVLGQTGPPTLALMRWWSTRGSGRVSRKEPRFVRAAALRFAARQWGRKVLHVWDRGYAGRPWLGLAFQYRVRFVLRWPKGWHLADPLGAERPAWQFTRGQRAWDSQYLRDGPRRELRKVSVLAVCLKHPHYASPLWLVVTRSKGRAEPWYLLTNEPIETEADAWRIVRAYARRWQIELCFRYSKSELALESPRLWTWERRLKLLLLTTLVYAFLLTLLPDHLEWLRTLLLRYGCHRTGKRARETPSPLYRLRSALGRLWLAYPAQPVGPLRNPG